MNNKTLQPIQKIYYKQTMQNILKVAESGRSKIQKIIRKRVVDKDGYEIIDIIYLDGKKQYKDTKKALQSELNKYFYTNSTIAIREEVIAENEKNVIIGDQMSIQNQINSL